MAISTTAGIFRKSGDTLDYTPSAAVAAGKLIVTAGCNCLALWPIAANEAGSLKILHKGEVVQITTDEAIGATDAGTALYVVAATGLVTKTSTSNVLLGYARKAIGATDLSFEIVCA
jgi:predicted RecA/RadA family phage recombinase